MKHHLYGVCVQLASPSIAIVEPLAAIELGANLGF